MEVEKNVKKTNKLENTSEPPITKKVKPSDQNNTNISQSSQINEIRLSLNKPIIGKQSFKIS